MRYAPEDKKYYFSTEMIQSVIRIIPDAPEHVLGSNKKYYHSPLIFAVVGFASFVVLLILILR